MEKVKILTVTDGPSGVNEGTGKSWAMLKVKVSGSTQINESIEITIFKNVKTEKIKVGDELDLEIWKHDKYGWQAKIPKEIDNVNARLDALEESVNALLKAIKPDMGVKQAPVGDGIKEYDPPVPTDEDDLPF